MSMPPRILVVDDRQANLVAMQRLLKGVAATVVLAHSGEAALNFCMRDRFALALIDVHMPDMDGFELAGYLRGAEKTKEMPIIFVTATLTAERHTLQGYRFGAVDYIQKPVDDHILLSKVAVFLELYTAREELRLHRDHLATLVLERTASLEKTQAELRNMNRHIHQVREEEQRRIARAMHDEMGNTLAQQKMTIEWLQINMFDHDRMHQELECLKHQVEDAIAKVRHITLMLRPPILDQCGLLAALEWQAAEFAKSSTIPCQVHASSVEVTLDENRKIALFRILQESLTNISRHACASAVNIALTRTKNRVTLTIEDNGRGIPEEILLNPHLNLGLRGMEERACQNGGELHVESSPSGTRITATLPLPDLQTKPPP